MELMNDGVVLRGLLRFMVIPFLPFMTRVMMGRPLDHLVMNLDMGGVGDPRRPRIYFDIWGSLVPRDERHDMGKNGLIRPVRGTIPVIIGGRTCDP